jgi:glycosyltransferase involved in cell wall biosynthesis
VFFKFAYNRDGCQVKKFISLIVPCKNEERNIERCLNAIIGQEDANLIEVVVVDNGSEDGTLAILEGFGPRITILSLPDASIAQVRNYGVRYASADWLAFIDGDVEVAHDWLKTLLAALDREGKAGTDVTRLVTGSTCTIPEVPSWIERVWFAQLAARDSKGDGYINSGHMIVHQKLFDAVGGFSPSLETGEDEAFCVEAVRRGGVVRNLPEIRAIHHGYPKTLGGFFQRERWHGLGMEKHLREPWRYRDLMLAFYYWVLLLLLCASVFVGIPLGWSLPLVAVCLVFPLLIFSISRTNGRILVATQLTVIFLVYGAAKTVALGEIFMRRLFPELRRG